MGDLIVEARFPEHLPLPVAANHFRITRLGGDVQLTLGYIDLSSLTDALDTAKESDATVSVELPVDVGHRVTMGPRAFQDLKDKVNYIFDEMVKSGHIKVVTEAEQDDDGNQTETES